MRRYAQAWYVSLLRGVFALLLGFSLIFIAEKTVGNLVQFIGIFWLMSGYTSIRLSRAYGDEARWSLIAGVLGVITGLVAIGRPFFEKLVAQELVIILIGVASIVTGLLHILGGFLTQPEHGTHWAQGNRLLGLIEIVLGIIALSSPYTAPKVGYWVGTAWALGAGGLLIIQAFQLRLRAHATNRKWPDNGSAQVGDQNAD